MPVCVYIHISGILSLKILCKFFPLYPFKNLFFFQVVRYYLFKLKNNLLRFVLDLLNKIQVMAFFYSISFSLTIGILFSLFKNILCKFNHLLTRAFQFIIRLWCNNILSPSFTSGCVDI